MCEKVDFNLQNSHNIKFLFLCLIRRPEQYELHIDDGVSICHKSFRIKDFVIEKRWLVITIYNRYFLHNRNGKYKN